MPAPTVKLSFFKLNVPDMDAALAFYRGVFGFEITQTFDEDAFLEHIMALPGQEAGPNLLLVAYKDGRDVSVGPGHGPVGLVTDDIDALCAKAVEAGANPIVPAFEMGAVKVGIVLDPWGHELELLQFPAG
ncbi:VOC family protein [Altererythrobacter fulvus]|uniref:VOC family protein n=1 Tax=Caenibius fulvus TaxID=2126012 RepID=UPI003017D31F